MAYPCVKYLLQSVVQISIYLIIIYFSVEFVTFSFLKFFDFLECHFSVSLPITVSSYLSSLFVVFPKGHMNHDYLLFS